MNESIYIDESAKPIFQKRVLLESLRTRRIDSRLLYESRVQSEKWMAIHKKYSPIKNEDTFVIYKNAYEKVIHQLKSKEIQVISLGCGSGNKDLELIAQLIKCSCATKYVPCDVSATLAISAGKILSEHFPQVSVDPIVCDLRLIGSLGRSHSIFHSPHRIILFFGILPSVERSAALKILKSFLNPGDILLMSANLSPHSEYDRGLEMVLPQYNNAETADWLLSFCDEYKIPHSAGKLRFEIGTEEPDSGFKSNLKRIQSLFRFEKTHSINIGTDRVEFNRGDEIRLFISNRYSESMLQEFGSYLNLSNSGIYISNDLQEGVLLGVMGK